VWAGVALAPVVAQAAPSAQEICMAGLLKAKAKYEKCVADWMSKEYGGKAPDQDKSVAKLAKKCRIKYAAEWTKLSSSPKLAGTTCDQARYEDNGNGTVTDHLTSLTWEKKSDDGGIHDKDNSYTWSTGAPFNGDGEVYTTFLIDGLNTPGFAGASDWRLPTITELNTILLPQEYPCATSPCVPSEFDSGCVPGCAATACSCTVPAGGRYWSATSWARDATFVWLIVFDSGLSTNRNATFPVYARAVRGGL
jgi:hypothetical protein